jgi:hypothetical protein
MHIKQIGIDIGKNSFHLVALGMAGDIVIRRQFTRSRLIAFFEQRTEGRLNVAFEACSGALVIGDPEALLDDVLEVDAPPAHHTVDRPIRAGLHDLGEFRLLRGRQPPRVSTAAVVLQPGRAMR